MPPRVRGADAAPAAPTTPVRTPGASRQIVHLNSSTPGKKRAVANGASASASPSTYGIHAKELSSKFIGRLINKNGGGVAVQRAFMEFVCHVRAGGHSFARRRVFQSDQNNRPSLIKCPAQGRSGNALNKKSARVCRAGVRPHRRARRPPSTF